MIAMNAVQSAGDDSRQSKLIHMLKVFLRPGQSLNRFEAEKHHDHCLHSTVSTLEHEYGIVFDRRFERVPCLHGTSTVRCKRYWLRPDPDNLARTRALLIRKERGQ